MVEELGTSLSGTGKLNIKGGNAAAVSVLRNRSTSPTIIPKKNLIRKSDNTMM